MAFVLSKQLTLTLKMTTAQVVETSVTVNNNSPIQDYVHPDDQTQTFEMTPGFKPFTITPESIKFTKRAELRTDFWQLDDIFESPGRNELTVWKTDSRFFFSRLTGPTGVWGSRASRALDSYATHYRFFFTDFEKKADCLHSTFHSFQGFFKGFELIASRHSNKLHY